MRTAGFAARPSSVDSVVFEADIHWLLLQAWTREPGGAVVLVAPAAGWRDLLPGQQVTARGVLAPSRQGELTVAVLRVRGPPQDVDRAPPWQRAAEVLRSGQQCN